MKNLALGILLFIAAFIAYLNFDELQYSEYWLQNRIQGYSCIEPLLNTEQGSVQLKYNFVKDGEIDIEVILNDAGFVFLSTGSSNVNRSFNFKTTPESTQEVIQKFKSKYPTPEQHSTEDHLSSLYYTLIFTNFSTQEEYEIGYYNYVPNENILELTEDLIMLGNDVLDKL